MIQPNELRIGNFIDDFNIGYNMPCIVESLNDTEINGRTNDYFEDQLRHRFEPISLTEEWLLKFGFTKYGKNTFYKKDEEGNGVGIKCDDWGIFSDSEFIIYGQQDWVYLVGYLQYVHQLQNLFFSLTGKELEYDSSK